MGIAELTSDAGVTAVPPVSPPLFDDDDFIPEHPFDFDGLGLALETSKPYYAQVHVPDVTEDDYAGDQLPIYTELRKTIRTAVNINTKWKPRRKALEWCFVPEQQLASGIDFRNACLALGARPHVIQARIQHQLFISNIALPEPLPFLAIPFPEAFTNEVLMTAWELGLRFCKYLWTWPGIRADLMRDMLSDVSLEDFRDAADKLEKAGLIGMRLGCWFFIARGHDRMARRTFSWSKSILD